MPTKKETDQVRRRIEGLLRRLGEEIELQHDQEKYWAFVVKHGDSKVVVYHSRDKDVLVVYFKLEFHEELLKAMTELQADPSKWTAFSLGLNSTLSSPLTGYRIKTAKDGVPVEYQVSKLIFPFDDGFTIKDLYEAIQAVASKGMAGINFLSAAFGGRELKQEWEEREPPDTMYR